MDSRVLELEQSGINLLHLVHDEQIGAFPVNRYMDNDYHRAIPEHGSVNPMAGRTHRSAQFASNFDQEGFAAWTLCGVGG